MDGGWWSARTLSRISGGESDWKGWMVINEPVADGWTDGVE